MLFIINDSITQFLTLVCSLIAVVGTFVNMCTSLQNKTYIQVLANNLDSRLSQLINTTTEKANAIGQMQGRDWAAKNSNETALAVVSKAANTASDLLNSAALTATKLSEKNS